MFAMNETKTQNEAIPSPSDAPEDAIVSPDTRRSQRIPPGQSRTKKWPVLDAGGPPVIDLPTWTLSVEGLVEKPVTWDWPSFLSLPRVKVFSDFHCVTRWSRLGNVWEGVSTRELVKYAGGLKQNVRFVLARGHDSGWTANLPIEDFMAEDALVAYRRGP